MNHVRARLRTVLPNGEVKSLILYGSWARGKARPDSDIDLFLLYDDATREQEESLEELSADLLYRVPAIHLFAYSAGEFAKQNGRNRLIHNVTHNGILIQGAPVPKLEINRRQVAERSLELAAENLDTAQLLLNTGKHRNAISISFYAVLYAADAALATKGFVAHSHDGTNTLFSLHFLRKGLVDKRFNGLFKRIHSARIKADYEHDAKFTRDDAEYWLVQASEFVAAIQAARPRWLAE